VCEGYGHRVQQSVFEVACSEAQLLAILQKLADIIDARLDDIRMYRLTQGTLAPSNDSAAQRSHPTTATTSF